MSLAPAEKTIVKNFRTFQNLSLVRTGSGRTMMQHVQYLFVSSCNGKQLRTNSWTSDGFVIRFLGANFSIVQRQQFFIFPVFFFLLLARALVDLRENSKYVGRLQNSRIFANPSDAGSIGTKRLLCSVIHRWH